jgi:hypothetical protein
MVFKNSLIIEQIVSLINYGIMMIQFLLIFMFI